VSRDVFFAMQPVTFEELEQAHDWSRDPAQRSYGATQTKRPSGKLYPRTI